MRLGRWTHAVIIYPTTQLYKPTLQPMTSSAFTLNLRQSNVMDVPGQEIDDPDRVRPSQRGNDEMRIKERKKKV